LRDLRLAALADAPYAFASTLERERDDQADQWRSRLRQYAWLVAEADGLPVGLAAGITSSDGVPGRRHLISMWVRPTHRGLGIAARLIDGVREWAVADGAHELALWVADGNAPAMTAYRNAGFEPTGRRQPLPSNPAVGEEMWVLDMSWMRGAPPHGAAGRCG
jgi:GNAT superfamily N-acetyltransferase